MINSANTSLLFPGQGSQMVGMGRELYQTFEEAKEVFLTVDEILKQNLSKLMFEGDADELTLTQNAQPAIMVVSMALMGVLKKQVNLTLAGLTQITAGHSLGEYSALCAAEAFSLENTAALLRIRGNAMTMAASGVNGGMLALIGAELDMAEQLVLEAKKLGICEIANDNGAGQVVLSGEMQAIDRCVELHQQFKIKKAIKLNVSAPFHSSLMTEAAIAMQQALTNIVISKPLIPVLANYSAEAIQEPAVIKESLVKQVVGRVRWREAMEKLINNYHITNFVEVGPGQVLTTIARRMAPDAKIYNLATPSDIENFVANL